MAAITTVPFYKTADKLDHAVRPSGVKSEILRLLHGITAAQNRSTVDDFLHPIQLGVSKAGAHKLIHCLRMSYELPRDELVPYDWVLVALDFNNAHSSVYRGQSHLVHGPCQGMLRSIFGYYSFTNKVLFNVGFLIT